MFDAVFAVMAKKVDKNPKLTYPPGCKELNEELSKDELVKRLKVRTLRSISLGFIQVCMSDG